MLWSSFLQKQAYQVIYQGSIHAVLIMPVLWKKTEFYKGESDREGIVIVAAGLKEGTESLLQQAGFPIMGALPYHQNFPPPHESLSSPYCKPTCFFRLII